MNRTKIQWADYTANPIAFQDADGKRVWACEKVSPASNGAAVAPGSVGEL